MHRHEIRLQPRAALIRALVLLAAGVAGLLGCSDERISLQQFIDQYGESSGVPDVAVPTTQPAGVSPADLAAVQRDIGRYRVGPGDVIGITVYQVDVGRLVVPIESRVNEEGHIELPVVGQVKVGGLTLTQADAAIRDALVPNVYQDVVIHTALVEPEPTRVLVYGAVTTPGLVQLRRTERNLLFAMAGAGGVSQLASGNVKLKRITHPDEEIIFNLVDPSELQAALAAAPLQNGDIVEVEAAPANTIFVGGLVLAPAPQTYPPGTTVSVLQALAAAGGPRTDVFPKSATLLRRMPDGTDVRVKLDLSRLTHGDDPNITLATGDILWIPETWETRVQDWINRNVFLRVGASATYSMTYDQPGIGYLNSSAARSGGGGFGDQQQSFDPLGFLQRSSGINQLVTRPPVTVAPVP